MTTAAERSERRQATVVTGATGLLGRALLKELANDFDGDVIGTGLRRATGANHRLDLLDAERVRHFLLEQRPATIVHAAAERKPDISETDPDATRALNVEATRTIAAVAEEIGAWVVYLSTDYVFDGTNPPYSPEAAPNPLNFYGRSKLEGEEVVRELASDGCILRVPVLFGELESLEESPVGVIAESVARGGKLKLDHWQTRYPTFTPDVAVVCRRLLERKAVDPDLRGTFHWSGDEALTKYEIGRIVAEVWGLAADNLVPDPDPPCGAPRPKDTRLDCSRLESMGIGRRTRFRDALRQSIERFRPSGPR